MSNDETQPYFTFAWEGESYGDVKRMELMKEMVKDTTHLIIIGYSFPFFNRVYDKAIIKSMTNSTSLEKIYYQDPILDGQFLKTQYESLSNKTIKHISDTKNFFIPTEF